MRNRAPAHAADQRRGRQVHRALALLMTQGVPLVDLLVVVGLLLSLAAARAAFAVHVDLPSTSAPRHPVLFCNPKSGGGKAMRFALAQEAGQRGIEAVELQPGDGLEALVRPAVARGADGLAMAGGGLAGHRRRDRRRARTAIRMYPGRDAQPLRARSRHRPRRCRRRP